MDVKPSTPRSSRYSLKGGPETPKTPTQETVNIDMEDVRRKLDSLVPFAGRPIRALQSPEKENFQSIVRYIQMLHDTDSYKPFFDEVQKKMLPAVAAGPVEPGTVGAYFTGCLSAPDLPAAGEHPTLPNCSAVCAGSMPVPPSVQSDPLTAGPSDFCKYTVVWANHDGHGYKFMTLNETNDKSHILVYVDGGKNKPFSGFTHDEKQILKKYGAHKANVIRYANGSYSQLLGGFRELDEIPERVNEIPNSGLAEESAGGGRALTIVLLIVLLLVAAFVGYKIWQGRTA